MSMARDVRLQDIEIGCGLTHIPPVAHAFELGAPARIARHVMDQRVAGIVKLRGTWKAKTPSFVRWPHDAAAGEARDPAPIAASHWRKLHRTAEAGFQSRDIGFCPARRKFRFARIAKHLGRIVDAFKLRMRPARRQQCRRIARAATEIDDASRLLRQRTRARSSCAGRVRSSPKAR